MFTIMFLESRILIGCINFPDVFQVNYIFKRKLKLAMTYFIDPPRFFTIMTVSKSNPSRFLGGIKDGMSL